MHRLVVLPKSKKGWAFLISALLLVLAGIWPVISLVNKAVLVAGLPLMIVWSYLIIFACVGFMLLGNWLLDKPE